MQIELTLQRLLRHMSFVVGGCLMGGESVKREKARLRKGINFLVCTPGRLLYHLRNTRSLTFDRLKWLVIDEADRVLDLGFEREMN